MEHFLDSNGSKVTLAFEKMAFEQEPEHVFIICRYEGKWVLTNHKIRGFEFPGGKREKGETLIQAAIREVYEETGGVINKEPIVIGEYKVQNGETAFIKRIYFAEIDTFHTQDHYFETNGPVLKDGNLLKERVNPEFSFIMKDDVVRLSLQRIETAGF